MGVSSYEDLKYHIGHNIQCVRYGKDEKNPENVSIECEDCYEVLLGFDRPDLADF